MKDEPCPINQPVYDEFELSNKSDRKVKFKFDPVVPPTAQLSFNPVTGTIPSVKNLKTYFDKS